MFRLATPQAPRIAWGWWLLAAAVLTGAGALVARRGLANRSHIPATKQP
jgi:polyferredoxin